MFYEIDETHGRQEESHMKTRSNVWNDINLEESQEAKPN